MWQESCGHFGPPTKIYHILYFGLRFAYMIFSPTEQLSKILQTTDVTLQDAQTAVAVTQRFIQRQRSHDEFQTFFTSVTEASKDLTKTLWLPRQQKLPQKLGRSNNEHEFQSPSEYFRQQYFEVLDLIVNFRHRFDQKD